jgi:cobalt-zinc-cadmium efflux system membrane fusion protein
MMAKCRPDEPPAASFAPARRLRALAPLTFAAIVLGACAEEDLPEPPAATRAERPLLAINVGPSLVERLKLGSIGTEELRETLRVPGRIEVDEQRVARVGSSVVGRITDLDAVVGQSVRRGQVLAHLSSTELSATQLDFLKASSQEQLAQRSVQRAQQLLDADVIGQAELQRRENELAQAKADLSAARNQLSVLGMSEPAIKRLAASRTVTSQSTVVSSIGGTVIERRATLGQVVQPADTIFIVADLSNVWLVADIPEQNAGLMRIGETVEAEVAALPGRSLKGEVSFVAATVNPDTRTIRVRMDVPNPDRDYKPAMLATVSIRGKPVRRQTVPSSAVVREDNQDYVFVVRGPGKFQLRRVVLGSEHGGTRVLVSGLAETDEIVVDGAFHLNNERKRLELQGS